jgi:hypothetical protein
MMKKSKRSNMFYFISSTSRRSWPTVEKVAVGSEEGGDRGGEGGVWRESRLRLAVRKVEAGGGEGHGRQWNVAEGICRGIRRLSKLEMDEEM